jgi:hypothetical protein
MNEKQIALYWREWGGAVTARKRDGLQAPDRHEVHVQALGYDRSMKVLTNAEFDKVLGAFRAISQPENLGAQVRQVRMPRVRMIWKLERELCALLRVVLDGDEAAAEGYILEICQDKYRASSHLLLKEDALGGLLVDVTRAINQRRKKMGLKWGALRQAAGLT